MRICITVFLFIFVVCLTRVCVFAAPTGQNHMKSKLGDIAQGFINTDWVNKSKKNSKNDAKTKNAEDTKTNDGKNDGDSKNNGNNSPNNNGKRRNNKNKGGNGNLKRNGSYKMYKVVSLGEALSSNYQYRNSLLRQKRDYYENITYINVSQIIEPNKNDLIYQNTELMKLDVLQDNQRKKNNVTLKNNEILNNKNNVPKEEFNNQFKKKEKLLYNQIIKERSSMESKDFDNIKEKINFEVLNNSDQTYSNYQEKSRVKKNLNKQKDFKNHIINNKSKLEFMYNINKENIILQQQYKNELISQKEKPNYKLQKRNVEDSKLIPITSKPQSQLDTTKYEIKGQENKQLMKEKTSPIPENKSIYNSESIFEDESRGFSGSESLSKRNNVSSSKSNKVKNDDKYSSRFNSDESSTELNNFEPVGDDKANNIIKKLKSPLKLQPHKSERKKGIGRKNKPSVNEPKKEKEIIRPQEKLNQPNPKSVLDSNMIILNEPNITKNKEGDKVNKDLSMETNESEEMTKETSEELSKDVDTLKQKKRNLDFIPQKFQRKETKGKQVPIKKITSTTNKPQKKSDDEIKKDTPTFTKLENKNISSIPTQSGEELNVDNRSTFKENPMQHQKFDNVENITETPTLQQSQDIENFNDVLISEQFDSKNNKKSSDDEEDDKANDIRNSINGQTPLKPRIGRKPIAKKIPTKSKGNILPVSQPGPKDNGSKISPQSSVTPDENILNNNQNPFGNEPNPNNAGLPDVKSTSIPDLNDSDQISDFLKAEPIQDNRDFNNELTPELTDFNNDNKDSNDDDKANDIRNSIKGQTSLKPRTGRKSIAKKIPTKPNRNMLPGSQLGLKDNGSKISPQSSVTPEENILNNNQNPFGNEPNPNGAGLSDVKSTSIPDLNDSDQISDFLKAEPIQDNRDFNNELTPELTDFNNDNKDSNDDDKANDIRNSIKGQTPLRPRTGRKPIAKKIPIKLKGNIMPVSQPGLKDNESKKSPQASVTPDENILNNNQNPFGNEPNPNGAGLSDVKSTSIPDLDDSDQISDFLKAEPIQDNRDFNNELTPELTDFNNDNKDSNDDDKANDIRNSIKGQTPLRPRTGRKPIAKKIPIKLKGNIMPVSQPGLKDNESKKSPQASVTPDENILNNNQNPFGNEPNPNGAGLSDVKSTSIPDLDDSDQISDFLKAEPIQDNMDFNNELTPELTDFNNDNKDSNDDDKANDIRNSIKGQTPLRPRTGRKPIAKKIPIKPKGNIMPVSQPGLKDNESKKSPQASVTPDENILNNNQNPFGNEPNPNGAGLSNVKSTSIPDLNDSDQISDFLKAEPIQDNRDFNNELTPELTDFNNDNKDSNDEDKANDIRNSIKGQTSLKPRVGRKPIAKKIPTKPNRNMLPGSQLGLKDNGSKISPQSSVTPEENILNNNQNPFGNEPNPNGAGLSDVKSTSIPDLNDSDQISDFLKAEPIQDNRDFKNELTPELTDFNNNNKDSNDDDKANDIRNSIKGQTSLKPRAGRKPIAKKIPTKPNRNILPGSQPGLKDNGSKISPQSSVTPDENILNNNQNSFVNEPNLNDVGLSEIQPTKTPGQNDSEQFLTSPNSEMVGGKNSSPDHTTMAKEPNTINPIYSARINNNKNDIKKKSNEFLAPVKVDRKKTIENPNLNTNSILSATDSPNKVNFGLKSSLENLTFPDEKPLMGLQNNFGDRSNVEDGIQNSVNSEMLLDVSKPYRFGSMGDNSEFSNESNEHISKISKRSVEIGDKNFKGKKLISSEVKYSHPDDKKTDIKENVLSSDYKKTPDVEIKHDSKITEDIEKQPGTHKTSSANLPEIQDESISGSLNKTPDAPDELLKRYKMNENNDMNTVPIVNENNEIPKKTIENLEPFTDSSDFGVSGESSFFKPIKHVPNEMKNAEIPDTKLSNDEKQNKKIEPLKENVPLEKNEIKKMTPNQDYSKINPMKKIKDESKSVSLEKLSNGHDKSESNQKSVNNDQKDLEPEKMETIPDQNNKQMKNTDNNASQKQNSLDFGDSGESSFFKPIKHVSNEMRNAEKPNNNVGGGENNIKTFEPLEKNENGKSSQNDNNTKIDHPDLPEIKDESKSVSLEKLSNGLDKPVSNQKLGSNDLKDKHLGPEEMEKIPDQNNGQMKNTDDKTSQKQNSLDFGDSGESSFFKPIKHVPNEMKNVEKPYTNVIKPNNNVDGEENNNKPFEPLEKNENDKSSQNDDNTKIDHPDLPEIKDESKSVSLEKLSNGLDKPVSNQKLENNDQIDKNLGAEEKKTIHDQTKGEPKNIDDVSLKPDLHKGSSDVGNSNDSSFFKPTKHVSDEIENLDIPGINVNSDDNNNKNIEPQNENVIPEKNENSKLSLNDENTNIKPNLPEIKDKLQPFSLEKLSNGLEKPVSNQKLGINDLKDKHLGPEEMEKLPDQYNGQMKNTDDKTSQKQNSFENSLDFGDSGESSFFKPIKHVSNEMKNVEKPDTNVIKPNDNVGGEENNNKTFEPLEKNENGKSSQNDDNTKINHPDLPEIKDESKSVSLEKLSNGHDKPVFNKKLENNDQIYKNLGPEETEKIPDQKNGQMKNTDDKTSQKQNSFENSLDFGDSGESSFFKPIKHDSNEMRNVEKPNNDVGGGENNNKTFEPVEKNENSKSSQNDDNTKINHPDLPEIKDESKSVSLEKLSNGLDKPVSNQNLENNDQINKNLGPEKTEKIPDQNNGQMKNTDDKTSEKQDSLDFGDSGESSFFQPIKHVSNEMKNVEKSNTNVGDEENNNKTFEPLEKNENDKSSQNDDSTKIDHPDLPEIKDKSKSVSLEKLSNGLDQLVSNQKLENNDQMDKNLGAEEKNTIPDQNKEESKNIEEVSHKPDLFKGLSDFDDSSDSSFFKPIKHVSDEFKNVDVPDTNVNSDDNNNKKIEPLKKNVPPEKNENSILSLNEDNTKSNPHLPEIKDESKSGSLEKLPVGSDIPVPNQEFDNYDEKDKTLETKEKKTTPDLSEQTENKISQKQNSLEDTFDFGDSGESSFFKPIKHISNEMKNVETSDTKIVSDENNKEKIEPLNENVTKERNKNGKSTSNEDNTISNPHLPEIRDESKSGSLEKLPVGLDIAVPNHKFDNYDEKDKDLETKEKKTTPHENSEQTKNTDKETSQKQNSLEDTFDFRDSGGSSFFKPIKHISNEMKNVETSDTKVVSDENNKEKIEPLNENVTKERNKNGKSTSNEDNTISNPHLPEIRDESKSGSLEKLPVGFDIPIPNQKFDNYDEKDKDLETKEKKTTSHEDNEQKKNTDKETSQKQNSLEDTFDFGDSGESSFFKPIKHISNEMKNVETSDTKVVSDENNKEKIEPLNENVTKERNKNGKSTSNEDNTKSNPHLPEIKDESKSGSLEKLPVGSDIPVPNQEFDNYDEKDKTLETKEKKTTPDLSEQTENKISQKQNSLEDTFDFGDSGESSFFKPIKHISNEMKNVETSDTKVVSDENNKEKIEPLNENVTKERNKNGKSTSNEDNTKSNAHLPEIRDKSKSGSLEKLPVGFDIPIPNQKFDNYDEKDKDLETKEKKTTSHEDNEQTKNTDKETSQKQNSLEDTFDFGDSGGSSFFKPIKHVSNEMKNVETTDSKVGSDDNNNKNIKPLNENVPPEKNENSKLTQNEDHTKSNPHLPETRDESKSGLLLDVLDIPVPNQKNDSHDEIDKGLETKDNKIIPDQNEPTENKTSQKRNSFEDSLDLGDSGGSSYIKPIKNASNEFTRTEKPETEKGSEENNIEPIQSEFNSLSPLETAHSEINMNPSLKNLDSLPGNDKSIPIIEDKPIIKNSLDLNAPLANYVPNLEISKSSELKNTLSDSKTSKSKEIFSSNDKKLRLDSNEGRENDVNNENGNNFTDQNTKKTKNKNKTSTNPNSLNFEESGDFSFFNPIKNLSDELTKPLSPEILKSTVENDVKSIKPSKESGLQEKSNNNKTVPNEDTEKLVSLSKSDILNQKIDEIPNTSPNNVLDSVKSDSSKTIKSQPGVVSNTKEIHIPSTDDKQIIPNGDSEQDEKVKTKQQLTKKQPDKETNNGNAHLPDIKDEFISGSLEKSSEDLNELSSPRTMGKNNEMNSNPEDIGKIPVTNTKNPKNSKKALTKLDNPNTVLNNKLDSIISDSSEIIKTQPSVISTKKKAKIPSSDHKKIIPEVQRKQDKELTKSKQKQPGRGKPNGTPYISEIKDESISSSFEKSSEDLDEHVSNQNLDKNDKMRSNQIPRYKEKVKDKNTIKPKNKNKTLVTPVPFEDSLDFENSKDQSIFKPTKNVSDEFTGSETLDSTEDNEKINNEQFKPQKQNVSHKKNKNSIMTPNDDLKNPGSFSESDVMNPRSNENNTVTNTKDKFASTPYKLNQNTQPEVNSTKKKVKVQSSDDKKLKPNFQNKHDQKSTQPKKKYSGTDKLDSSSYIPDLKDESISRSSKELLDDRDVLTSDQTIDNDNTISKLKKTKKPKNVDKFSPKPNMLADSSYNEETRNPSLLPLKNSSEENNSESVELKKGNVTPEKKGKSNTFANENTKKLNPLSKSMVSNSKLKKKPVPLNLLDNSDSSPTSESDDLNTSGSSKISSTQLVAITPKIKKKLPLSVDKNRNSDIQHNRGTKRTKSKQMQPDTDKTYANSYQTEFKDESISSSSEKLSPDQMASIIDQMFKKNGEKLKVPVLKKVKKTSKVSYGPSFHNTNNNLPSEIPEPTTTEKLVDGGKQNQLSNSDITKSYNNNLKGSTPDVDNDYPTKITTQNEIPSNYDLNSNTMTNSSKTIVDKNIDLVSNINSTPVLPELTPKNNNQKITFNDNNNETSDTLNKYNKQELLNEIEKIYRQNHITNHDINNNHFPSTTLSPEKISSKPEFNMQNDYDPYGYMLPKFNTKFDGSSNNLWEKIPPKRNENFNVNIGFDDLNKNLGINKLTGENRLDNLSHFMKYDTDLISKNENLKSSDGITSNVPNNNELFKDLMKQMTDKVLNKIDNIENKISELEKSPGNGTNNEANESVMKSNDLKMNKDLFSNLKSVAMPINYTNTQASDSKLEKTIESIEKHSSSESGEDKKVKRSKKSKKSNKTKQEKHNNKNKNRTRKRKHHKKHKERDTDTDNDVLQSKHKSMKKKKKKTETQTLTSDEDVSSSDKSNENYDSEENVKYKVKSKPGRKNKKEKLLKVKSKQLKHSKKSTKDRNNKLYINEEDDSSEENSTSSNDMENVKIITKNYRTKKPNKDTKLKHKIVKEKNLDINTIKENQTQIEKSDSDTDPNKYKLVTIYPQFAYRYPRFPKLF